MSQDEELTSKFIFWKLLRAVFARGIKPVGRCL